MGTALSHKAAIYSEQGRCDLINVEVKYI